MTIDTARLLNWPFKDVVQTYDADTCILYALGIGLGADPMDAEQLRFVYEKKGLRAFPTLPVVLCYPGSWASDPASGINYKLLVHGEQGIEIHRPLAPGGTLRGKTRITSVIDKGEGRGALVYVTRELFDEADGVKIATLTSTTFARGDGGFGGPSGPVPPVPKVPEGPPDEVVEMQTAPNLALLYRLNADRNPLHADPAVAAAAGFPRPILHGLATYGVAAHAVLKTACGYDPALLRAFSVRFSAPVYPGETIAVEMWRRGEEILFRAVVAARGARVLDNGRAVIGPARA